MSKPRATGTRSMTSVDKRSRLKNAIPSPAARPLESRRTTCSLRAQQALAAGAYAGAVQWIRPGCRFGTSPTVYPGRCAGIFLAYGVSMRLNSAGSQREDAVAKAEKAVSLGTAVWHGGRGCRSRLNAFAMALVEEDPVRAQCCTARRASSRIDRTPGQEVFVGSADRIPSRRPATRLGSDTRGWLFDP